MSHEEAAAKKREAAAGNDKNADGEVTAIGPVWASMASSR